MSEEGRWLAVRDVNPHTVRLDSETDAVAAARAGDGVMLALAHVVRDDLRDGRLVPVPVEGTPIPRLWFATTVHNGRISQEARTLQAFVTTPDATAAMVTPGDASRAVRRRSAVRVRLWS